MGLDLIFAGAIWFAASILLGGLQPPYVNFEIELNRQKNRLYIRSQDQPRAKTVLYPLSNFNGFGVRDFNGSQAELFLKIRSEQGDVVEIPVQKHDYPVPHENAQTIAEAIDGWLRLSDDTQLIDEAIIPDEPAQEEEIFRDFRDME